jgi:hypothetical protein
MTFANSCAITPYPCAFGRMSCRVHMDGDRHSFATFSGTVPKPGSVAVVVKSASQKAPAG